jgi:transcriptional regulator GlxA family with amidase domain
MECGAGGRHSRMMALYPLPDADTAKPIGLVLCNGFALPQVASVLEMFQSANALAQSGCQCEARAHYEVLLLSVSGGRVSSSSSVFVWTESIESRRYSGGFHALFVAGDAGTLEVPPDERLIRWLRREGRGSHPVVPIGGGRLLMEAAGLKQAGNGWEPALRAVGGQQHVEAEGFAGSVEGPFSNAFAIIEQDFGGHFAREAATRVVPCNQPAYFAGRIRENAAGRVSAQVEASVCWLEANSDRPITIDEAARVAAMSDRNFLRRFKVEMGVTPSEYLLFVRIDMCCRLLLETDLPVDKVARRCGLGSGGRLAKLFRKHLSTTPMDYRANAQRVRG